MNTRIDAKHKARRPRHRHTGQLILATDKLRNQFGRQILLADILGVMRGEMIPRQTERTDPQLRPKVHLTVRIEDGVTCGRGAADGIVIEGGGGGGRGGQFLEGGTAGGASGRGCGVVGGGVEGADGSDASCGFETGGGPAVEGEAGSGCFFRVVYPVLLLHCCDGVIGFVSI